MGWEWSWNLIRVRKKEYKELLKKSKKLEAIRNTFPALKSHIDVGDKIGMSSAIKVIEEVLETENKEVRG